MPSSKTSPAPFHLPFALTADGGFSRFHPAVSATVGSSPLPLTESKKKPHHRALVSARGDGVGRSLTEDQARQARFRG